MLLHTEQAACSSTAPGPCRGRRQSRSAGPRGGSGHRPVPRRFFSAPRRGLGARPLRRRSQPNRVPRAPLPSNPDAARRPRPARDPLPGHHGHLPGPRAPDLAGPAAAGGRGWLAPTQRAAAGVPGALSVRARRQDAAPRGLLGPGALGAALQPQRLHLLPVSAPPLLSGMGGHGDTRGREATPKSG